MDEILLKLADLNQDGKLDYKDLIILSQTILAYLAGKQNKQETK